RPLDVVLGHAHLARLVDGVAQLQVHGGVAAAVPGGDDDRPAELAPQLAPLGVDGPLLVLDRCPVGMAGHGALLPGWAAGPRPRQPAADPPCRLAGRRPPTATDASLKSRVQELQLLPDLPISILRRPPCPRVVEGQPLLPGLARPAPVPLPE